MLNVRTLEAYIPDHRNLIMGVSDINDYVPTICCRYGNIVTENSFTYFKPEFNSMYFPGGIVRNASRFCDYVSRGRLIEYMFRKGGIEQKLFTSGGNILDKENNFLLIFAIKSSTLIIDYSNLNVTMPCNASGEIDPAHLKLFVSTEFMSNPVYRTVYNKVHREVILPCLEKGMEISYLLHEEIDKKLFNDGLNRNFETITDARNYLSPESTRELYNYLTPLEMASVVGVAEAVESGNLPF